MSLRNYFYGLLYDTRDGLGDRVVKFLLWLLSLVYGAIAYLRRQLYNKNFLPVYRSPVPVISVGNITLGGVGKTPLVIAIVRALKDKNIRAAVLLRGYMPQGKLMSDEALMLQESLAGVPIIIGANRRQSIEECLKHHAVQVFVLDDAFGHMQVGRDLDIMAISAVDAFGNEQVIPRGALREPLSSLSLVNMVVITKTDQAQAKTEEIVQRLPVLTPKALIVQAVHRPKFCVDVYEKNQVGLEHVSGLSVVGFCGIGDSGAFQHTLQTANLHVVKVFSFMDHHGYTEADMEKVRHYAQEHNVRMIVTTHKDAVKLPTFKANWDGFKVYYLGIDLEITHGKNVFIERILSVIRH